MPDAMMCRICPQRPAFSPQLVLCFGHRNRWLRDLLWDHIADVLRSPTCPRSAQPVDFVRRAAAEPSAFLEAEAEAPGGGHDPSVLGGEHVHRSVADLRNRERLKTGASPTSKPALPNRDQPPDPARQGTAVVSAAGHTRAAVPPGHRSTRGETWPRCWFSTMGTG
ncbi:hypothetical protein AB0952_22210 [Streptomyces caniferus]|uniref:hypothetical protein n=1 Tax=Streptomyces caniferus TaxID=285557 RepID=UPI003454DCD9